MKLFSLLLGIMLFFPSSIACQKQDKVKGEIVEYEFNYSSARAIPKLYIKVYRDQDGTPLIAYLQNGTIVTVYSAPEIVFSRIDQMVKEANLRKLKDHYDPIGHVLDGNTWSLRVRYEEGAIYSGGYQSWPPRKYHDAIDNINGYIKDVVVECGDEAVKDRYPYHEFLKADK